MKKIGILICLLFLLLPITGFADTIPKMDGDFSDWQGQPMADAKHYQVAFIVQGNYAYVYIKSHGKMPARYSLSFKKSQVFHISLKDSEFSSGKVKKSKCMLYDKNKKLNLIAYTVQNKSGKINRLEMRIPLRELNRNVNQSMAISFSILSSDKVTITTAGVNTF